MSEHVGIVLGSGLGCLVEHVKVSDEIPFTQAGIHACSVKGHEGRFVLGRLGSVQAVLMAGRLHLYEGHDARAVTAGIRWMAEQGVSSVILTNAAGSLREDYPPGKWMLIEDQINLTGTSPLEGTSDFINMCAAYDPDWMLDLELTAASTGVDVVRGVYAGLRGPQYESPAEIRMLRALGADAVGMSTVLETIQARALGMRVLGLSCITNYAAGMVADGPNHAEVLETGRLASSAFITFMKKWFE